MESGLKLSKFEDGQREDPTLFKSLVGSLRYLRCTRPNILYAVELESHFIEAPTSTNMKVAQRSLNSLDFFIATLQETMKIERTLVVLYFSRVIVLFQGAKRSNLLSHFQHVSQSSNNLHLSCHLAKDIVEGMPQEEAKRFALITNLHNTCKESLFMIVAST
jgi:hypothetical protein